MNSALTLSVVALAFVFAGHHAVGVVLAFVAILAAIVS